MKKKNGFVPVVIDFSMINNTAFISILIALVFCSCNKTSTPKEFLYEPETPKEVYQVDVKNLEELTLERYDSIRITKESEGIYKSKYSEIKIDTIFYGSLGKIAYLAVGTRNNKYVAESQLNDSGGVEYVGECFIGVKKDDTYQILKPLKYSVNSYQSYDRVLKSLREIYFREMEYIEGMYNINDTRFWDSSVW
jgi:hypothetical protein